MESEKTVSTQAPRRAVAFASAGEANRRVAGIAAAARVVRDLAEAGIAETWLTIGDGRPLAPATLADIERLRGTTAVRVVGAAEAPADIASTPAPAMSAMAILRGTVKPSDGLVSRYLNRPISQRISYVLLALPGARPIHATIASAIFALILFWGMLAGGKAGLILGAILFQAASVIDGVDGEMARATYRSTDFGKTLDSAVDMATNLLFILGLTVHLGRHGSNFILWTGLWSLCLVVLGAMLIGWRVRAGGAPLSFDLLKRPGRRRGFAGLIFWAVQVLTGRDCFAFLFMVLIIAGLAQTALVIFSVVATLWFLYVLASLLPGPHARFRNAA